jgi:phage host-nuclease inhibitor protein Gam
MSAKKISYASPAHAAADQLLAEWDKVDREVKALEGEAATALAVVQEEWADKLRPAKERRACLGAALEEIEKEQQAVLFGEVGPPPVSVSLDLPAGTLLYDKTEYVVKPRKVDVLANLERYGFEEAIIRTKATNWEVLANKEEWPDEALAIIGTRREIKETFAYEVKEA